MFRRGCKLWPTLAVALMMAATGCATRGYVRERVADLDTHLSARQDSLSAGLVEVRGNVGRAWTKADSAMGGVELARRLALGNTGFREAGRFRVFFDFDSAELSDASCATLDQVASEILQNPRYLVAVCGFTDSVGSAPYNLQLGERRAEAVRRYLAGRNPAELNRFQSISFGKTPPETEVRGWGEGAERRQVAVLLVERTANASEQQPTASQSPDRPGDRELKAPEIRMAPAPPAHPGTSNQPLTLEPQEKSEEHPDTTGSVN